jgi:hypothetical protein
MTVLTVRGIAEPDKTAQTFSTAPKETARKL